MPQIVLPVAEPAGQPRDPRACEAREAAVNKLSRNRTEYEMLELAWREAGTSITETWPGRSLAKEVNALRIFALTLRRRCFDERFNAFLEILRESRMFEGRPETDMLQGCIETDMLWTAWDEAGQRAEQRSVKRRKENQHDEDKEAEKHIFDRQRIFLSAIADGESWSDSERERRTARNEDDSPAFENPEELDYGWD